MTKQVLLQWVCNVCISMMPVYFVFDMVFIYGYVKLHKYKSNDSKRYLMFSVATTVLMLISCIAIQILTRLAW